MTIKKRMVFFLIIFSMLFCSLPVFSLPEKPTATALPTDTAPVTATASATAVDEDLPDSEIIGNVGAALLIDIKTSTVMYSKNADTRFLPGTTAKMMAALVFIEQLENRLDETVTVPSGVAGTIKGEHIELKKGETFTVSELLHAVIMYNAGDAAITLALFCCDTTADFVALMNEKADFLGMSETHYNDLLGENEGAYTTASDVAKLANKAYENALYREICLETVYEFEQTRSISKLYTRNYFLSGLILPYYTMSGVNGLCAGYIYGGNAVSAISARIGERDYMCIILDAKREMNNKLYNFIAAKELLNWGNGRFTMKTLLSSGTIMGEIKVRLAEEYDYVCAMPEKDLSCWLLKSDDSPSLTELETTLFYDVMTAPVKEGEIVGKVEVYYSGKSVGSVNLVTMRSLPLSRSESRAAEIGEFLRSKTFYGIVGAIVLLTVIGILVKARVQYIKNKKST